MKWSISVCFGWASSLPLVDPFSFMQTLLCPLVDGMSYQMASRIDNGYQSFSGKAGSHLLFFLSHLSPRWKCPWSSFNHSLTFSHSPILFASFRGRIPHRFHLCCLCNPTLQRGYSTCHGSHLESHFLMKESNSPLMAGKVQRTMLSVPRYNHGSPTPSPTPCTAKSKNKEFL